MDTLKPWSTTIALGQRILEELKLDREMDTLGRWLAHYLAEKMESAASAPEGAEGESARRECVDLILRLWERRQRWPLSAPLKNVADQLEELLRPKPRFLHATSQTTDKFLDLLRIPRKPSTHNDLKPSTCSSRKPSTDNNACRHAHPNGLGSVFFYRIWGSPWRAKPGADFPVQHNSFGCTILLQR